ncbi:hypothetical protein V8C44DRAFT_354977 [Trichoderma aethiopicum]
MVRLSVAALLACSLSVYALGDPAGAKNVGNGNGGQFIGGECLSSKDCASTCCAFISGGGVCSGIGAQFQAGKSGCGFGDGGAAPAPSAPAQNSGSNNANTGSTGTSVNVPAGFNTAVGDPAGVKNLGNGAGQQFITGICLTDADCASGCCAGLNGGAVCSGVGAQFQNGKTGCGFPSTSSASDSNNAAAPAPATSPAAAPAQGSSSAPASAPAGFNTAVGDPAGVKNLGNGAGQQFITGICLSDADCASGCCAALNGGAVCSGVGAQFQNGKTGCGFSAKKRSVPAPRVARSFRA